eukprot:jgi/Bigna1/82102/fgenesh1_pg.88_\
MSISLSSVILLLLLLLLLLPINHPHIIQYTSDLSSSYFYSRYTPRPYTTKGGVHIAKVKKGSQAERAGVKEGWIIVAVNGHSAQRKTFREVDSYFEDSALKETTVKFDPSGLFSETEANCSLKQKQVVKIQLQSILYHNANQSCSSNVARIKEKEGLLPEDENYVVLSGIQVRQTKEFHGEKMGKIHRGTVIHIGKIEKVGERLRGQVVVGAPSASRSSSSSSSSSYFEGGWVTICSIDQKRWWLKPQEREILEQQEKKEEEQEEEKEEETEGGKSVVENNAGLSGGDDKLSSTIDPAVKNTDDDDDNDDNQHDYTFTSFEDIIDDTDKAKKGGGGGVTARERRKVPTVKTAQMEKDFTEKIQNMVVFIPRHAVTYSSLMTLMKKYWKLNGEKENSNKKKTTTCNSSEEEKNSNCEDEEEVEEDVEDLGETKEMVTQMLKNSFKPTAVTRMLQEKLREYEKMERRRKIRKEKREQSRMEMEKLDEEIEKDKVRGSMQQCEEEDFGGESDNWNDQELDILAQKMASKEIRDERRKKIRKEKKKRQPNYNKALSTSDVSTDMKDYVFKDEKRNPYSPPPVKESEGKALVEEATRFGPNQEEFEETTDDTAAREMKNFLAGGSAAENENYVCSASSCSSNLNDGRRRNQKEFLISSSSEDIQAFFERVRGVKEQKQNQFSVVNKSKIQKLRMDKSKYDGQQRKNIKPVATNKESISSFKSKEAGKNQRRMVRKQLVEEEEFECEDVLLEKREKNARTRDLIRELPLKIQQLQEDAGRRQNRGKKLDILREAERLTDRLRSARQVNIERKLVESLRRKRVEQAKCNFIGVYRLVAKHTIPETKSYEKLFIVLNEKVKNS